MTRERTKHVVTAVIMAAIGLVVILIGTDVIAVDPDSVNAPSWVLVLVGLLMMCAAGAVVARQKTRLSLALTGAAVTLFAVALGWVGFFGKSEAFSGGIPFLPSELNLILGRGVFIGTSLVVGGVATLVWRDVLMHPGQNRPGSGR